MLKRILVALDGSEASRLASAEALALAKETGGEVVGLGVLDVPGISRPEPVPIGGMSLRQRHVQEVLQETRTRIQGFLEDFVKACREAGVPGEPRLREGEPYLEIARESCRHDLTVISQETHFRFATQDEEGDTLQRLAWESPRPLLAVPPQGVQGRGVLIAYDGSRPAAQALQLFQLLNPFPTAPRHVISVQREEAAAEALCREALDFLEQHALPADPIPVASEGEVAEILLTSIRALRPRLLVMGAFGHRGLREKLFGSTTEHLLFKDKHPFSIFLYH